MHTYVCGCVCVCICLRVCTHMYYIYIFIYTQLLTLVKGWAQARNINDAAQHTLNSFGFTLLVIQVMCC